MRRRMIGTAIALVAAVSLCVGLVGASPSSPSQAATPPAPALAEPQAERPNIVLILMDDFPARLLRTMPYTMRLKRKSATFPHAFVADSLCCPSRASLLTGKYPHNTGVRTNERGGGKRPIGGYLAFKRYGNAQQTIGFRLNRTQRHRYLTGFMGKYLNQYGKYLRNVKTRRPEPGWTIWNAIPGGGYKHWDYTMTQTERGRQGRRYVRLKHYGKRPRDYATTVLSNRAAWFINHYETWRRPYFLEVSTFATHTRVGGRVHPNDPLFPPAFQDRPSRRHPGGNCGRVRCRSLDARDLPGFNDRTGDNRPRFLRGNKARRWQPAAELHRRARQVATQRLRDQARMAQSVDRLVRRVVRASGPNTYVIVTADNGFHLGQHRARLGKGSPYDYDIRVPLIVRGPVDAQGRPTVVPPGPRRAVVSNVDLAPTIEWLSGRRPARFRDGRSFHRVLFQPRRQGSRFAFVEHTKPYGPGHADPDDDSPLGGTTDRAPSYVAVRTKHALLVRYDLDNRPRSHRFAFEYYPHIARHGFEKTNRYAKYRNSRQVRVLRNKIATFTGCGPARCRRIRG
jgi:N-acetylglucosamine-6-sulfatase